MTDGEQIFGAVEILEDLRRAATEDRHLGAPALTADRAFCAVDRCVPGFADEYWNRRSVRQARLPLAGLDRPRLVTPQGVPSVKAVSARPTRTPRSAHAGWHLLVEANGPWPAVGMLHHSCFTEGPKLAVYEIWESQEVMDKFGQERLMPVLKELNFDVGEPAVLSINVVQA